MKKIKKILAFALVMMLTFATAVGMTVAYLTDDDEATNVFTVGKVKIELHEADRDGKVDDEYRKALAEKIVSPIVIAKGETKYDSENYIDKLVTVENIEHEAYVRLIFAVPAVPGYDEQNSQSDNWLHWNVYSHTDNGTNGWYWGTKETGDYPDAVADWNSSFNPNWKDSDDIVVIDGKNYSIYIATNILPIATGATTEQAMRGFFIDEAVDYDNDLGTYTITDEEGNVFNLGDLSDLDIKVFAQAVQTAGFESAWDAFKAADLPNIPWEFENYVEPQE